MRHICFACDDYYSKYTYVAARSFIQTNAKDECVIHILSDDSLREDSRNRLKELGNITESIDVDIIDVSNVFDSCNVEEHLAIPTYYRLILPQLLKDVDWCLYLDSDVLIVDDLSYLFDFEKEEIVYGVKQIGLRLLPDGGEAFCKEWGLATIDRYVNGGVLMMNLKRIREMGFVDRFVQMAKDKKRTWPGADQFIINKICYDYIGFIPYKYNIGTTYVFNKTLIERVFSELEINEAYSEPVVIHYAEQKPWRSTNIPYAEKWWDCVKKTKYYNEYLEDFMQYQFRPSFHRFPAKKEFEEILHFCKGQLVVIYGAGDLGRRALDLFKKNNVIPFCMTISDSMEANKIGKIEGVNVYGINELVKYNELICVFIAAPNYCEEINAILDQKGFRNRHIFYEDYLY